MSKRTWDLITALSTEVPAPVLADLAQAAAGGCAGLDAWAARAQSPVARDACARLAATGPDTGWDVLAAALVGAAAAKTALTADTATHVNSVWTGPHSGETGHRLTGAVVIDLINEAQESILLVSYAARDWPPLVEALTAARRRGVHVVLVLERAIDNPAYRSPIEALRGLDVTQWAWPPATRPPGASLHAKLLVVDASHALVGSANLTDSAMDRNLECGVLIRGGPEPRRLWQHMRSLRDRNVLIPVGRSDLSIGSGGD